MPPHYVKPYVKRQKNDMPDAAAIFEAVSRPAIAAALPHLYTNWVSGSKSLATIESGSLDAHHLLWAFRPGDGSPKRHS